LPKIASIPTSKENCEGKGQIHENYNDSRVKDKNNTNITLKSAHLYEQGI
jgi:hypothetical protein